MNYEQTIKDVKADFNSKVVTGLSDFVRIPNLSPAFDPEWKTNGRQENAGKFLLNWALNQGVKGIKGELIEEKDRTPLVFLEIDANGSDKAILLYGHFDKQPYFGEWAEGLKPTEPVIKNGKMYGRGASDDGYALFAWIEAIKAIQLQGQKHGQIFITIEGGEESGSPDLEYYLDKLHPKIGKIQLMICLDSGCVDYNSLWLTSSLRGFAAIILTVECMSQSVHSGTGSGLAPDSFTIMRQLLDRVQDSKTGNVLAPLTVEIPSDRIEEAKKLAELCKEKVVTEFVSLLPGVKAPSDDYAELVLNNTWRPTAVVTGMTGFPEVEVAGNVLRGKTTCKISFRLPPTFKRLEAEKILIDILSKDPPYNAKVTAITQNSGNGWAAKTLPKSLQESFNRSSMKLYGKELAYKAEGGSIPFLSTLGEKYPNCQIVATGVLGPESNAHCINESLNLQFTENMIVALAHALNDFSIA